MKKALRVTFWVLLTIALEIGFGYLMALGVSITKAACDFATYLSQCAGCALGVTIFMIFMFMIVGFPFYGFGKAIKTVTEGKGLVK